jgi:uncharacterized protein YoaH (UPF0181 family)
MKRAKPPKAPAPSGKLIDAGHIVLAGDPERREKDEKKKARGLIADAKHRNRRETQQVTVEAFEQLLANAAARGVEVLPPPMDRIVLTLARAGLRQAQGRGPRFRSLAERNAIQAALQEGPGFYARYLAQAKASGRFRNPRAWARQKAAEEVRRLMTEVGVSKPPSIQSIAKKRMRPRARFSRSETPT